MILRFSLADDARMWHDSYLFPPKKIAQGCSGACFVRSDQLTACQIQIRSKYGHLQRGN